MIAVVFLTLLAIGVLHYRNSQNEVTITIDKQKGRETTERIIEKGKELSSKIGEHTKGTFEKPDSAPQAPVHDH